MLDAIIDECPDPVPLAIELVAVHLQCWPGFPPVPACGCDLPRLLVKVDMRALSHDDAEDEQSRPVPTWRDLQAKHAEPVAA